MAEQMGTPGSNADTSVNGGKGGASKDKACPFCQQQFTSSSLGRHLDLYIKEKNPKPADGIHNVEEIKKMRGNITRRQPRNSTSRREDSTPRGTPAADRRSPRPESLRDGNRSPSLRREEYAGSLEAGNYKDKTRFFINKGTWESTGVMNVIPPARNGDARSWNGDEDNGRRLESRSRSVSKQMLAKTTFEQKQKMIDALDNAKAAELALRELLGSVRAAKQRIEGPGIFDYDPLTLDFPALALQCLPPPPTLHQSTQIPSSSSWSVTPPDEPQYQALRAHFNSAFRKWRVSCAIATTTTQDDLSYPPTNHNYISEDHTQITERAEAEAADLESKISEHLHAVFAYWASLSLQRRTEIWTIELARGLGRKSDTIKALKKEKELDQQEIEHLKQQVADLSHLQLPREFKISAPSTVPLDGALLNHLGELGVGESRGVGFSLLDRNEPLDTVIERAIGRWKGVVREARGGGGLSGQKSLSGEHSGQTQVQAPLRPPAISTSSSISANTTPIITTHQPEPSLSNGMEVVMSDQDADADADADADMEEDDSFADMNDHPQTHQRAPEAHMSLPSAGTNFRLSNGGQQSGGRGMEGMETSVPGYVSIPAR